MVVLDEAKSELAQLRREIAGQLRVAAFPSIASAVLPETVKALRTVFPRLDIVVEEMEPSDGLGALGSWRTDVALIDDISTAAAAIVPLGSRPRVARTALRSVGRSQT
jgi:DNA-binding transcriptional LysR family regulator